MQDQPEPTRDQTALKRLLQALQMEKLEENLFRGPSIHTDWRRVYGGQVLGQALSAAAQTVPDDRMAHSLHAYFLLAGDPQAPIVYDVEALRDGGSFSTRRTRAIQHGKVIFVMSASFHIHEDGLDHASPPPDVPGPDGLRTLREILTENKSSLPKTILNFLTGPQPIEIRPVDPTRFLSREPREPIERVWLRASAELPNNQAVHASLMAYASDFSLLQTALLAHGRQMSDPDIQLASLDHAMWFHRPFRADQWLLYAHDSPTSSGSRGYSRGQLFTESGKLIASTVQEGLMRVRTRA